MVYVLLGKGFEEMEALAPIDLLRRAGIGVITVGSGGQTVYGSHNVGFQTDITIDEMDLTQLEMVVLPGGLGGVASIRGCQQAMEAVEFAVLAQLHITDGIPAVCYPGCEEQMGGALMVEKACVRHENVITAASAGCAIPFALELIRALRGDEAAQQVAQQIVIR